jgi:hypothetical protein
MSAPEAGPRAPTPVISPPVAQPLIAPQPITSSPVAQPLITPPLITPPPRRPIGALLSTALAAAALLAIAPAPAATPLANLVAEDAPVVILVDSIPDLIKKWNASPLAKTWNDPEVREFFAPLKADMKASGAEDWLKQHFGHDAGELLSFARGGALLAVTDASNWWMAALSGTIPVLAVVELGDDAAKLEELLNSKAFQEKTRLLRESERYAGATLHTDRYGGEESRLARHRLVWTISEGSLYASPSRDLVAGALDAARAGGATNPFGKSERYLRMKERARDAQALLAMNLKTIVPVLDTLLKAQASNPSTQLARMFDLANLTSILGLDALEDFCAGARIADDWSEVTTSLTYAKADGLLRLLAVAGEGPFAQPGFLAADSLGAVSMRFNFPAVYDALLEIIRAACPLGHTMLESHLAAFNQNIGIDLRRDLIGVLGDDLFVIQRKPTEPGASPGAIDTAFVFPLKDGRLFEATLDTLRKATGLDSARVMSAREYLGATIHTLEPAARPGKQLTLSYAIQNRHFIIGTVSAVESILQGMADRQDSIWRKPDIIDSLADVPGDAIGYSFTDMPKLMEIYFEAIVEAANAANARNPEKPRTFGPKPTAAALEKYWGGIVGYNQRDATGVYGKNRVYHKR